MSERLLYDETKFDRNVKSEDILETPDDNDFAYFFEVDIKYRDYIKQKTKHFQFAS